MIVSVEQARELYEREKLARDAEKCRKDFYHFFKSMWSHVDTSPFLDNWSIGCIAEHLAALRAGELKKLAINVPPGTGKSLIASVAFPAWVWADDPTRRFFSGSYLEGLAKRDAGKTRVLMGGPWYTERFGELIKPGGSDSNYATKAGGWRFAFGMGTFITGRHPDYHIIDDPNDPKVVNVEQLEKTIEWKKSKLSTRRRDPAHLRQLLIMQRVHDMDLAGYCIEEEGFYVLRLPMRRDHSIVSGTWQGDTVKGEKDPDPRKEDGELLWPERYPENVVKEMETVEMGPTVAAAQFQQDPVISGGAIITKDDLAQEYDELPDDAHFGYWLISGDLAFKSKQESDYVALQVWLALWPNFYLVDRVYRRIGFVDTIAALRLLVADYPLANTVLIEDKANGPALMDQLKDEIPGLIPIEPLGDKVARLYSVQGFFRSKNVWLPKKKVWTPEYKKNLQRFPKAKNDDDVDATTQALRYMKANTSLLTTAGKWGSVFGPR